MKFHGIYLVWLLSALLLFGLQAAQAQSEKVLYSFCPQAGCGDGALPGAGVVMDGKGNLYGTTQLGGADNLGTVFKLSATETEKVLHSFGSSATDGLGPLEGLVMDKHGNLYGTTPGGGAGIGSPGTVFEVSPSGVETILYSFCSLQGCVDGFHPESALIKDKSGNLYGTTAAGGEHGGGTVFEFSASGVFTTLYNFCSQTGCTDGDSPRAGLVMDKNGNLYGTTYYGGANNFGTVFELSAGGAETPLHSFANDGTDGTYPMAGLVIGKKGKLYGTTTAGGASGGGVVFAVTTSGTETIVHTFADTPDGFAPYDALVIDKEGNFYGTTSRGGTDPSGYGTVFEVTAAGAEKVLYSFTAAPDGAYPYGGVVLDKVGNLYGTTQLGGANNKGTVFKVTP
jgi:uncharacterized repeat protein (TIGR03803 family)